MIPQQETYLATTTDRPAGFAVNRWPAGVEAAP